MLNSQCSIPNAQFSSDIHRRSCLAISSLIRLSGLLRSTGYAGSAGDRSSKASGREVNSDLQCDRHSSRVLAGRVLRPFSMTLLRRGCPGRLSLARPSTSRVALPLVFSRKICFLPGSEIFCSDNFILGLPAYSASLYAVSRNGASSEFAI